MIFNYGCSGRPTVYSHPSVQHTHWEPAVCHDCLRVWRYHGKQQVWAYAFDSVSLGLRNVLARQDSDVIEMENNVPLSCGARSLGGQDVNYFRWRSRVFFSRSYSLENSRLLLFCVITAICPWSYPSLLSTRHACGIYWNFNGLLDVCLNLLSII